MAFGWPVGLNAFISATALVISGLFHAGGSGRLDLPSHGAIQVFQLPARGKFGFVPVHFPGSVGTVPVQGTSNPSARARAITRSPTLRPSSRPALTSLGNSVPASRRERAASSAFAAKSCASSAMTYVSTAAAAPAAAACSEG
jgi:hypothetical protein